MSYPPPPPPPGYPPPMNWLYLPLTYLSYVNALLVHTLVMPAALFAVSAFLLWKMQLQRHIAPVLLAQACLLLLTPIGFTHLERGQFPYQWRRRGVSNWADGGTHRSSWVSLPGWFTA